MPITTYPINGKTNNKIEEMENIIAEVIDGEVVAPIDGTSTEIITESGIKTQ